jgi:uncharacterized membrane protein
VRKQDEDKYLDFLIKIFVSMVLIIDLSLLITTLYNLELMWMEVDSTYNEGSHQVILQTK